MSEQKTKPTKKDVKEFLDKITPHSKRDDCYELLAIMERITGEKAVVWGDSIVGFGKYHYKYESGHEGDSCLTGFSPRKQAISIYCMPGFSQSKDVLNNLGKFKAGAGCLYIKSLNDIDKNVLAEIIKKSVVHLKQTYKFA